MHKSLKKNYKYFYGFYLSLIFLSSSLYGDYTPRYKTDEELIDNLWTDHVNNFKKLFGLTSIDSFLEFGVGEGTYYFLQHCNHVRSVELLSKNNTAANEKYYNACLDLFKDYSNWKPSIYRCSPLIAEAIDIAETRIDPATIDDEYMKEINTLCDIIFSERQYEVAFVDPGIVIRGSIVQALFGRTKIIAAHDVFFHGEIYGWSWIPNHPDYEKISFHKGSGTSFWIHKDLSDLIQQLKNYDHD